MILAIVLVTALQISFRKAVAQYGEAAVESGARAKGISEEEIAKARRCLK